MNSPFVFVICIIALVGFFRVVRAYIEKRDIGGAQSAELDEAMDRIERSEERIQVLERIVTEKQFDLKKEIDSL